MNHAIGKQQSVARSFNRQQHCPQEPAEDAQRLVEQIATDELSAVNRAMNALMARTNELNAAVDAARKAAPLTAAHTMRAAVAGQNAEAAGRSFVLAMQTTTDALIVSTQPTRLFPPHSQPYSGLKFLAPLAGAPSVVSAAIPATAALAAAPASDAELLLLEQ